MVQNHCSTSLNCTFFREAIPDCALTDIQAQKGAVAFPRMRHAQGSEKTFHEVRGFALKFVALRLESCETPQAAIGLLLACVLEKQKARAPGCGGRAKAPKSGAYFSEALATSIATAHIDSDSRSRVNLRRWIGERAPEDVTVAKSRGAVLLWCWLGHRAT